MFVWQNVHVVYTCNWTLDQYIAHYFFTTIICSCNIWNDEILPLHKQFLSHPYASHTYCFWKEAVVISLWGSKNIRLCDGLIIHQAVLQIVFLVNERILIGINNHRTKHVLHTGVVRCLQSYHPTYCYVVTLWHTFTLNLPN